MPKLPTRLIIPTIASCSALMMYASTIRAQDVREPLPSVTQGEYDAAPYMVDAKHHLSSGKLVATVDQDAIQARDDAGLHIYDHVYITIPKGTTPKIGDRLVIAVFGDMVPDVGQVVQPVGMVSIDSLTDNNVALATIVSQFGAIQLGQRIIERGLTNVTTTVQPVHGQYGVPNHVIWIRGGPVLPSLQSYLMFGAEQGVHRGDVYTIYAPPESRSGIKLPPVATATVQIVRVTPLAATGLVITQTQPVVKPGMSARLTAKMPESSD